MPARYGSDLVVDLLKVLGIEYVALNPGLELPRHSRFSGQLRERPHAQSRK